MFRISLRTAALVLVSMTWGAALYVALFSDPVPPPSDGYYLEQEVESDHLAALLAAAEKRGAERFAMEDEWRERRGSEKRRHLNGASPELAVWRPIENLPPRVPGADFSIREPFHFPLPRFSRDKSELLQSPWITKLQEFLRGVQDTQVSLVTASIEHQDVLLNWLISATLVASPPLVNILVLTLDESVFDLMSSRNISTLLVTEGMVVRPSANVTRRFSQVHIVRLSVLRLLNHYSFSVVNYDCDAILLRNPQLIFDGHKDADIIGTFGKGPSMLYDRWGITLNTGVMLLRSNEKIEYYWELMSWDSSRSDRPTPDDQANINIALERANIRWYNVDKTTDIDLLRKPVYGLADRNIVAMLLPENKVCRYVCNPQQRTEYYVWHTLAVKENRTVANKMSHAKGGNAWFLRSDWLVASEGAGPHVMGVAWLRHIANPDLIR